MKTKLFAIVTLLIITGLNAGINAQNIGLVNIRHADQVITVGGNGADIPGFTSDAIQIALDAIKTRGGGTVKLSPGIFNITGPLRVPDNSSLEGSGKETILRKCDGFRTSFVID